MSDTDPYFIDSRRRVRDIQGAMAERGVDVYLGSRLRTLSWTLDAFCPWRSYVVIPPQGLPTAITFVIDAARVADDSWLDEDHVWGYGPMGGQDQISILTDLIRPHLQGGKGTENHKAAVVGDTVGDPFKDTAGPSINTLITVMSLIATVFGPLIAQYALPVVFNWPF